MGLVSIARDLRSPRLASEVHLPFGESLGFPRLLGVVEVPRGGEFLSKPLASELSLARSLNYDDVGRDDVSETTAIESDND